MPENDSLNGCLDEINVAFVEREATPKLLTSGSDRSLSRGTSVSEHYGRIRTVTVRAYFVWVGADSNRRPAPCEGAVIT